MYTRFHRLVWTGQLQGENISVDDNQLMIVTVRTIILTAHSPGPSHGTQRLLPHPLDSDRG